MLGRSLPEKVLWHLERITGEKISLDEEVLRKFRAPLKHERVSQVLELMLNSLSQVHPRFGFRHFYDPSSVNPETIAYWLIELAQQTRENFCGYAEVPSPEHYGRCASHRRQLTALFETMLVGLKGDLFRARPMEIYKNRIGDLLADPRNRCREIDLFVRRIGVRDARQRESIQRDIAEGIGVRDAFFIIPRGNAGPH